MKLKMYVVVQKVKNLKIYNNKVYYFIFTVNYMYKRNIFKNIKSF